MGDPNIIRNRLLEFIMQSFATPEVVVALRSATIRSFTIRICKLLARTTAPEVLRIYRYESTISWRLRSEIQCTCGSVRASAPFLHLAATQICLVNPNPR